MSLTIGSSGNLNQLIASMLAQMSGTATASATPSTSAAATSSSTPSATNNVVTGSGKAPYSNEIMNLFTRMHQKVGAGGGGSSTSSSSAATTTIASATTLATPIDSILSSIDADNDALSANDTNPADSGAADSGQWSGPVRALRLDE
jgi:hypothetical protein